MKIGTIGALETVHCDLVEYWTERAIILYK